MSIIIIKSILYTYSKLFFFYSSVSTAKRGNIFFSKKMIHVNNVYLILQEIPVLLGCIFTLLDKSIIIIYTNIFMG